MLNPTIVVIAYNRADSFSRLLKGISKAYYPKGENVRIIISIDKSGNSEVLNIANSFEWRYGEKKIIKQEDHLGLKKHVIRCGDLSREYESIIVLEDDLYVSKSFYQYSRELINQDSYNEKIAGYSLYSYEVAESCGLQFNAIKSNSSHYYMKVPCSWGQIWTKAQWKEFKDWIELNEDNLNEDNLPTYVQKWSENSWKKLFFHYLIEEDKYFLYPYNSYSSNLGEAGTNSMKSDLYKVSIDESLIDFEIQDFETSKVIYDEYFELEKRALDKWINEFHEYDYALDLYGVRPLNQDYYITVRQTKKAIKKFSGNLVPLVSNVINQTEGTDIAFSSKYEILINSTGSERNINNSLYRNYKELDPDLFGISIIIPVENKMELSIIINSFSTDLHIEWILISKRKFKNDLESLEIKHGDTICWIESSEDQISSTYWAFKHASKDFAMWCKPDTELYFDKLKKILYWIKRNDSVKWINSIDDSSESISNNRWSKALANKQKERAENETLELHIFKLSLLKKFHEKKAYGFTEFLNIENLYTISFSFGKSSHSSSSQISDKKHLNLIEKILYWFFINEVKGLKEIFAKKMALPPIIKYNEKDDNFFWSIS